MATTARKSTRQLLGELFVGLRSLARDHVREIKHERHEEKQALQRVPVQIGGALGVTLVGAILVGQALAHGLFALGVSLWLGYALVGVIVLAVGIVMLNRMPDRSEIDTVPETAIKRIGQDIKELANEVVHDVKTAGQPRVLHAGRPHAPSVDVTSTE